jgi:Rieske Fe-S protein
MPVHHPHLACQVPVLCESTKRFECLCHGSTYNILGEKLLKGPAERGMDRFPVSVEEDGTLVIDTSEVIRGAPEGSATFRDPHPPEVGCTGA